MVGKDKGMSNLTDNVSHDNLGLHNCKILSIGDCVNDSLTCVVRGEDTPRFRLPSRSDEHCRSHHVSESCSLRRAQSRRGLYLLDVLSGLCPTCMGNCCSEMPLNMG